MRARDHESIIERLVLDPQDEEALREAYDVSGSDTPAYADLLERIGSRTVDPSVAAYWLAEAATVALEFLGDVPRAAKLFKAAFDKDPSQSNAADRLAQIYRDHQDPKALAGLLDHRVKLLTPRLANDPSLGPEMATLQEELGTALLDPAVGQPKRALEHFRKAMDLDPRSTFAIYHAREILKSLGSWQEAFALYDRELDLERDPERRLAILRDEGRSRKASGDLPGASRAILRALEVDENNAVIRQEYAGSILERIQSGESVTPTERRRAQSLLLGLAEEFPGEHGLAYAGGALDIDPGNDEGFELFVRQAKQVKDEEGVLLRARAYLRASPAGIHGDIAREYTKAAGDGDASESNAPKGTKGRGGNVGSIETGPVTTTSASATGSGPVSPVVAEPKRGHHVDEPSFQTAPGDVEIPAAARPFAEARRDDGPAFPISANDADRVQGMLDAARMLSGKGKKPEAFAKYKEVLDLDPTQAEALGAVEEQLRIKKDYAQLKDTLIAAVRATPALPTTLEFRKERLREVANLCENSLKDVDGSIAALRQLLLIDRIDEGARTSLGRLFERHQRWDDLAAHLEQEANSVADIETKLAVERKLAGIHETKRRDLLGAAESWARIVRLVPDDERALVNASRLFERAGKLDRSAQIISDHVASIDHPAARGKLLQTLGETRETLGDLKGAAQAFESAAELLRTGPLWEQTERCFTAAEQWERAAEAAAQRALLSREAREQAGHYARASELRAKAGDDNASLALLEQASELDAGNDHYADTVASRFRASAQHTRLVEFLTRRANRIADRAKRVAIRREAAQTAQNHLTDRELSREAWLRLLEDGDDREAIERLVDHAIERGDHNEAATLLRRLGNIAIDNADKSRIALREAEILADGIGDIDTAITRYERILTELDPTSRPALQAIADLQEARDNLPAATDALERELKLIADPAERVHVAQRLARLYENIGDQRSAIRALDIVRKGDPEDYDALARLAYLCEQSEQWDRVATLLAEQIEVEGDESEAIAMTKKLAGILADKLRQGEDALAALTDFADLGDTGIRDYYVELGDRLEWKGIVASKLVDWWFEARPSAERTQALRGAFERFSAVGRDQDAVRMGVEVIRARGGDRALATHLEELALRTSDLDALFLAQEVLLRDLSGKEKATEYVRQAAVRVRAGVAPEEAIQFAEPGLVSLSPDDAEELLAKLAELTTRSEDVIDLYERHVSHYRVPHDRVRALAKAAEVSASRGAGDRARGFFELALIGTPSEETLLHLETAARRGDEALKRSLAAAFATGGGGARDGGKTRALLLGRAATLARRDLKDLDLAFEYLGDALVAHVDANSLRALDELSGEVNDFRRAEAALTRALQEVFDGVLVRQLLAKRAAVRREKLDDRQGAATDLRRLHDLSANQPGVLAQLAELLRELGDYRGLVQLYEDEILRGKDAAVRAELARKVARLWEEQISDAREAADAWRRVLRMKPQDAEAERGLERSKAGQLQRMRDPIDPERYSPPMVLSPIETPKGEAPRAEAKTETSAPQTVPYPPSTAGREPSPGEPDGSVSMQLIAAILSPEPPKVAEAPPTGAVPPPDASGPPETIASPTTLKIAEAAPAGARDESPLSKKKKKKGKQSSEPKLTAADAAAAMADPARTDEVEAALDFLDRGSKVPPDQPSTEAVDLDDADDVIVIDPKRSEPSERPRSIPPPLPNKPRS